MLQLNIKSMLESRKFQSKFNDTIEKIIFIQYAWILAFTFNTVSDLSSWEKIGSFLTKVLS